MPLATLDDHWVSSKISVEYDSLVQYVQFHHPQDPSPQAFKKHATTCLQQCLPLEPREYEVRINVPMRVMGPGMWGNGFSYYTKVSSRED